MQLTTRREKLENCSYWLNYHAYMQQQGNQRKPIKRFTPCPRSKPIIEAMNQDKPLLETINNAVYQEHCSCHPSATVDKLLNYCMDDRAKLAHRGNIHYRELVTP